MDFLKKIFGKKLAGESPVSSDKFYIISGSHSKPVVTKQLTDFFDNRENSEGFLYTGYPLIGSVDGANAVDAMLISKHHGIIVFDIVESSDLGDYKVRHDDIYVKLQSYLLLYKELIEKRKLAVEISIVSIAPQCSTNKLGDEYPVTNDISAIEQILDSTKWGNNTLYAQLNSVIQNITSIRSSKFKRKLLNTESRGSQLKKLEDSIANLDHSQGQAVINTFDGVQRIRGLAGSGKTIVLALKVAYLHAMNPDWDIAITFNSRALKGQFESLITRFIIERTKQEPDWDKISIIHAWGSSGGNAHSGIYYDFCKDHGEEYFDFSKAKAKAKFGYDDSFEGVCDLALKNNKGKIKPKYDVILVDEAQDFSSEESSPFLLLCYELLKKPKRFVYAYDELQSLSLKPMPSPEEIFGLNEKGEHRVKNGEFDDIVLYKCYRNSRPMLATAHALGFGIYSECGLIQMFEDKNTWSDIGYNVYSGTLEKGEKVVLERTNDTSPKFLEQLHPKDDLISFQSFKSDDEQIEFLVNDIIENLSNEELLPRDIIVINPNPMTTKNSVSKARKLLFDRGYNNSLAGVSNSPDIFHEKDAITFTGIYRAKGNEAGMVYVMNSQYCYDGYSLARKRNILFTAITRSKAWVRVLGYGAQMDKLCEEYNRIMEKNYHLDFKYPTDPEMKKMNLLNRDRTPEDEKKLKSANYAASNLLSSFEKGEIGIADIDPKVLKRLKDAMGGE